MSNGSKESREKLYNYSVSNNLYSKDLDEFELQFKNEESRIKLYNYVTSNNLYSKSLDEFNNKFFSDIIESPEEQKVQQEQQQLASEQGDAFTGVEKRDIKDNPELAKDKLEQRAIETQDVEFDIGRFIEESKEVVEAEGMVDLSQIPEENKKGINGALLITEKLSKKYTPDIQIPMYSDENLEVKPLPDIDFKKIIEPKTQKLKRSDIDKATKDDEEIGDATYNSGVTIALNKVINDSQRLMDIASKSNNFNTLSTSIGIGLTDYFNDYLDIFETLQSSKSLKKISEKIEKSNEGVEVDFTDEELDLVEALKANDILHKEFDSKIPLTEKVGESVGQSLGFALEFALTRGVGKSAASLIKGGSGAMSKFALGGARKIIGASAQAAAMPTFYKETAKKIASGEPSSKAIWDSYFETAVEALSETIFAANPFAKETGKFADDALRKVGSALADKKGFKGIAKATVEEWLEEKFGEILKSSKKLLEGQRTFENVKKDFIDPENNAVMALTVATMTVPIGTARIAGTETNKLINNIASKINLSKFSKKIDSNLKERLDLIVSDKDLSVQEMKEMIEKEVLSDVNTGDIKEDDGGDALINAYAYSTWKLRDLVSKEKKAVEATEEDLKGVEKEELPKYKIGEKEFESKEEFLPEVEKLKGQKDTPVIEVVNDEATQKEVNEILEVEPKIEKEPEKVEEIKVEENIEEFIKMEEETGKEVKETPVYKDLPDLLSDFKGLNYKQASTGTIYAEIGDNKFRISDHEPNFGAPRSTDYKELYTHDIDGKEIRKPYQIIQDISEEANIDIPENLQKNIDVLFEEDLKKEEELRKKQEESEKEIKEVQEKERLRLADLKDFVIPNEKRIKEIQELSEKESDDIKKGDKRRKKRDKIFLNKIKEEFGVELFLSDFKRFDKTRSKIKIEEDKKQKLVNRIEELNSIIEKNPERKTELQTDITSIEKQIEGIDKTIQDAKETITLREKGKAPKPTEPKGKESEPVRSVREIDKAEPTQKEAELISEKLPEELSEVELLLEETEPIDDIIKESTDELVLSRAFLSNKDKKEEISSRYKDVTGKKLTDKKATEIIKNNEETKKTKEELNNKVLEIKTIAPTEKLNLALSDNANTLVKNLMDNADDSKLIESSQKNMINAFRSIIDRKELNKNPLQKRKLFKIINLIQNSHKNPNNIKDAIDFMNELAETNKISNEKTKIKKSFAKSLKAEKRIGDVHFDLISSSNALYNNSKSLAEKRLDAIESELRKDVTAERKILLNAEKESLGFVSSREKANQEREAMIADTPIEDWGDGEWLKYDLLGMVGDKNLSSRDLIEIRNNVTSFVNSGRSAAKVKSIVRKAEARSTIKDVVSVIDPKLKAVPEEDVVKNKSTVDQFVNIAKNYRTWTESMPTLLDFLARHDKNSNPFESALMNFYLDISDASIRKQRYITDTKNLLASKAVEIFGEDYEMKNNSKQEDVELSIYDFAEKKYNKKTKKLTKNEAYHFWQMYESSKANNNNQNLEAFEKMGWTDLTFREIEDFMGEKVKAWANWQFEFYDYYYDRINEAYKRIKGVNLPKVNKYVPSFRKVTEGLDYLDLLQDNSRYAHLSIANSLKRRTPNKNPFKQLDGDDVLLNHISKMEHFIWMTEPLSKFSNVMQNADVRNIINQLHGTNTNKFISGFIEDLSRGSINPRLKDSFWSAMRQNFVIATIGLSIPVLYKQLTSFPAYMGGVNFSEIPQFNKYFIEFLTNPKKFSKDLMNTDYMKNRYDRTSLERELAEIADKAQLALSKNKWSSIQDKSLFLAKFGDKAAILMGGYPYFKVMEDRYLSENLSPQKAKEKALKDFVVRTVLTQQSGEMQDLSHVQRMGDIGAFLTLFQNSPLQYFRMEMNAITNLVTGRGSKANNIKSFLIYHFVLPSLFQAASAGLFGSDESDWYRTLILGSLGYGFIVGKGLKAAIAALQGEKDYGLSFIPVDLLDEVVDILEDARKLYKDDEITYEDLYKFSRDGLVLSSKFVGLPIRPIFKVGEGIYDYATGATNNELRLFGYSNYALNEANLNNKETRHIKKYIDESELFMLLKAKEKFGEDFNKHEKNLKKKWLLYKKFGFKNDVVNAIIKNGVTNKEKAEIMASENEENKSFEKDVYNYMYQIGAISKDLSSKYEKAKLDRQ